MGNIEQELSWDNLIEQASDLGIGGDGDYLTIEDKENVVRILSEPIHYGVYFQGKGNAPIYAENASDELKTTGKLSHKFACYVYNQKNKKVQLADFGWSIVKAIAGFAKSSQNSYTVCPPYDIIINKSGSGMQTEYNVMPGRNESPLSDAILTEFGSKQDIKELIAEKVKKQAEGDAPAEEEHSKKN